GGKSLSNRTLTNAGLATWAGTGNISMGGNAVWNNLPTAALVVQTDATLGGGGSTFNNGGLVNKAGGTGTTTLTAFLNDTRLVDVASGALNLNGGGAGGGTYSAETAATLQFGGGNHTLTAGSLLAGAGNVRFSGGNVQLAGSYGVTGDVALSGGTAEFDV